MASKLKDKEEKIFKLLNSGQLLDAETLIGGLRLIQGSDFMRAFTNPDVTITAAAGAARKLDRELQEHLGGKRIIRPLVDDPGSGGGSGGVDAGAGAAYSAGLGLAAAVLTAAAAPEAAAVFGVAALVSAAISAFSALQ